MKQAPKKPGEVFWPKTVLKKWLNLRANDSEFSADEGSNDSGLEEDDRECGGCEANEWRRGRRFQAEANGTSCGSFSASSPLHERRVHSFWSAGNLERIRYKLKRRNSETLRAQVCIGTWNVGGQFPPENLDVSEWVDMEEPADIYALGIQEIVPLNAGNIFGAEDSRPVTKWEDLIRDALNRIRPIKTKYKCYGDPPSPSRFETSADDTTTMDELVSESDSDDDDEEQLFSRIGSNVENPTSADDSKSSLDSNSDHAESDPPQELDQTKSSTTKRLQRLNHFTLSDYDVNSATTTTTTQHKKLLKTLSTAERIGLIWPEQSVDLLPKHALNKSCSFRSNRSFRTHNPFEPVHGELKESSEIGLVPDLDLNVVRCRKKRLAFVRIISKLMVGIYLSIWVRRSLTKRIRNLKVSTVGVGVMGYIGNKVKKVGRNSEGMQMCKKSIAEPSLARLLVWDCPKQSMTTRDLNYRIDSSFDRTHELIASKNWSMLAERDQAVSHWITEPIVLVFAVYTVTSLLKRELKKGRAFDGWSEGAIDFPPTYKHGFNSTNYVGHDRRGGRRNPACFYLFSVMVAWVRVVTSTVASSGATAFFRSERV
ncbi:type I inositol-1,4,5-trisphosphate 5-phosphatase [Musa troglodytarum]|uniref:Type I inositol-1,4,5-trisphosphate 5-phosphatase n=1 Tax=Musa troglodytarum TaxID=320322 RepID=A0A9E7KN98_9LILI|nr:type I inositol-1,4,5-trisphosphate 5-phosphatase [Musa troglodytarum]